MQSIPVAMDAAAAGQWRAPAFNFYDRRLLGGAWRNEERPDIVREFFRVLSVCHTVIPDGENPSLHAWSALSGKESPLEVLALPCAEAAYATKFLRQK